MKSFVRILSIFLIVFGFLFVAAKAQNKPAKKTSLITSTGPATTAEAETGSLSANEKAMFEAAQAVSDPAERIQRLKEFTAKYPASSLKTRAQELIVGARAELGDAQLRAGDSAGGVEQFKLAVKEAPAAMSDKLFTEILSQIPANLFFRGERAAAFSLAKKIEEKAAGNSDRLLLVAQFYLVIENAEEARRIALRAAELKPDSAAAQRSLGLANRIGFRLEAASQNFSRALELDPKSFSAKRGLADTLRGLGQTEEAAKLYRELLQENSADEAARTGLILSLFGAGNRAEAETEMQSALSANPANYPLLAGASYWYAAKGEGAKAVELGQKAIEAEPRYTWGYIALARGLLLEKRPFEAERALLLAKQYGDFPTLDYELATVRFAAGFYEEAIADLRKNFTLKNGVLETKLAGRVSQQASNFTDLLALERRAAILQHGSADSEENAARLKKLFALSNVLTAGTKDETALAEAVKDFVAGDDAARTHRNLYAANRLLNERIALPQAFELTQTATSGVDEATEIPAASAAVLADELFESRRLAAIRGEIVTVPDLPRSTLTNILRGRIEEIAGWTLYNQDKPEEAVVRLKRAVGILPADSTWWRSSQWRLGAALDKSGKGREALEAYVKSYRSGEPDPTRRTIIESTYVRVYGSTKGLDAKLGEQVAQSEASQPSPAPRTVSLSKNPLPEVIAQINKTSQPETRQSELPKEIISQPEQTSETTKVEIQPAIPEIVAEEAPIKPETTVTPEAAKPNLTPQSPEPEPTPESVSLEPEAKSEADDQTVEPVAKAEPVKTPLLEEVAKTDSQKSNDLVKVTQNSPRPRVLLIDRLKNTVTEIQPSPVKTGSAEKEPKGEKTSLSPEVAGETAQPKSTEAEPQTEEETGRKDRSRAASCAIWTSQDTISLLSAGGRVALLVGIEGAETADGLTADTSSPGDIEVKIDKDASKTSNRLLYEIRSISEKKGIFAVRFESDCGEKIVKVKVR